MGTLLKFSLIFLCFSVLSTMAQDRKYKLEITRESVQVAGMSSSGKVRVNNSLPAPTLHFVEGETAVIEVINKI